MTGSEPTYPQLAGLEPEDAKSALRDAIRGHREARSERRRAEAGEALAIVACSIPEVRNASRVALYAARRYEPQTNPLLERLHSRGKEVILPVLGDGLQREWSRYSGTEDLVQRAPGRPPEPSGPALGTSAIADADVVLVPALAVDTSGCRLGQGGGWYDRVLKHVRPGVKVIAVVYPDEVFDAEEYPLPRESHDRNVDAVTTPQRWFCFE